MIINVTQPLQDYSGESLKDEKGDIFTARTALHIALNAFTNSEQPDGVLKAKLFGLTQKIFASDEVDLSVEEAVLIKERCGLISPPLVNGRICQLIDTASAGA